MVYQLKRELQLQLSLELISRNDMGYGGIINKLYIHSLLFYYYCYFIVIYSLSDPNDSFGISLPFKNGITSSFFEACPGRLLLVGRLTILGS